MKLHKLTIHRLTADISCGCKVSSEYKDAQFKEVETPPLFSPCVDHSEGVEAKIIIDMMLKEYLLSEAEKLAAAPAPPVYRTPSGTEPSSPDVVAPLKLPSSVRVGRRAQQEASEANEAAKPSPMARAAATRANAASAPSTRLAGLTVASVSTDIDEVDADPRVDRAIENVLDDLVGDQEDWSK
jgi:hypothetical protein